MGNDAWTNRLLVARLPTLAVARECGFDVEGIVILLPHKFKTAGSVTSMQTHAYNFLLPG
jgi:hypothetical protein